MDVDASAAGEGAAPEVLALAKVVARLRSEVVDLEGVAATTAVVERAKGVLMAEAGISADAAYERLLAHAAEQGRSLLEECWITLGQVRSPPVSRSPAPPPEVGATVPTRRGATARAAADPVGDPASDPAGASNRKPVASSFSSGRYVVARDGRGAALRPLLARLADGLALAHGGDGVAELLRGVLGGATGVDAVMIYSLTSAGSLELTGRAGIGEGLADRWRHVPPLTGVAAHEAIASQRALWLEDPVQDARRYLLIGEPPGQWPSRAWIPVPDGGHPKAAIGFLRSRPGPFAADTRALLRRAARLCADPLGLPGPPRDTDVERPAEDADVTSVQRIMDALTGPAILLTPLRSGAGEVEDYRIDAAAPESVDVAGRRGRELVGRRILETYPTVAGSALWDGYRETLSTGTGYEGEPFVYEEVTAGLPRQSVFSVRASRLGDRLVVSWVRHDTSEREARRLADMQRLGNLGWAGWNLVTDTITWSDQVYAIFDRDPGEGPMTLEELPQHLLPDDLPQLGAAVRRLLSGGEAIDQPFRISTAYGVRHLRIVAEAQTDADGTPVEVHGFFQDVTAQRDTELALRESERAVLLQRGMLQAERALAARLQETLLPIPEQSLELAGLCVDVAYMPADAGINVGGDWYSAIGLPDGSALFVVGDVAGHGLSAVGTMAQLRFTAKGMTVTGSSLPDVLRRLNSLLLHTASNPSEGATATMVMARYQPWDRRLVWVRAGHLPPLLLRGDRAEFLEQPQGSLLGASFDASYAQAVLDLMPGDHLLLYTDGLVEEPGEDIEVGLQRLAATALRLLREGRDETLARTVAGLCPGHRDDICVLDIHVPDDL
ncbi:SpoIIE family protein phosphatase [Streptomyces sp. NBC_00536]|uniref:SpoIIE family protein phosphatase n=1 Tax=Streptomyces sp. NBC_00536 TaxID=2975769 RepID=UPI002E7FC4DD|nr:SpoIIE family protein phosphatase [Streptomyces sp. NBC_00536]WUC82925.1 SpoIIE family protein phosphatase [Streptomyces sp. NBC_00536]